MFKTLRQTGDFDNQSHFLCLFCSIIIFKRLGLNCFTKTVCKLAFVFHYCFIVYILLKCL